MSAEIMRLADERTHRLGNCILVGLPEALRALVLLLGLLVISGGGRRLGGPCSEATPLLAKEVDGVEDGLILGGRGRS